ncbi:uncharacterized protein [Euphorbia lathyris]|uniref:uncharacterized protein n=1 Tax=Euphorbia lathyris TaxID=212925 RepID=UPI0033135EC2
MEGLIPFVYRTIMQYKNEKEGPIGSWLNDSPAASYIRLPTGDSGRFQTSDMHLFGTDFTSSNSAAQVIVSTGAQSPLCRVSRRVTA